MVTISVAWFTIYRTESQALFAEAERARNVRSNLVSIIEEHVINEKPIDSIRLVRLIELKSREEKLTTRITVRELVSLAEYNILSSRYLDFEKKDAYKTVFEVLYKQMIPDQYSPFEGNPQAETLNELARNIQEGDAEASLVLLNQYVENIGSQMADLEKGRDSWESYMGVLVKSRSFTILMMMFFVVYLFVFSRFISKFVIRHSRDRALEEELQQMREMLEKQEVRMLMEIHEMRGDRGTDTG